MDFRWFSWIFLDFHWLSWIVIDFHGFSLIFVDFHGFWWIFMDFQWIFMNFDEFWMIFVEFLLILNECWSIFCDFAFLQFSHVHKSPHFANLPKLQFLIKIPQWNKAFFASDFRSAHLQKWLLIVTVFVPKSDFPIFGQNRENAMTVLQDSKWSPASQKFSNAHATFHGSFAFSSIASVCL